MNIFQSALIRIAQGFTGLFFFFVVSGYFGLLLLLPLGILYHLTNLFSGMGISGLLISIPVTFALFYYSYKIEGLYQLILNSGVKMFVLGKDQLQSFEILLTKADSSDSKHSKIASSH